MPYDIDSVLDFVYEHKFAILFQVTLLFGLSLYSLTSSSPTSNHTSQRSASAAASSPNALPSIMSGFAPKTEVNLAPPKDDPISRDELAKADGVSEGQPIWVAIKGTVFDVSAKKDMYGPDAGYHIFAGKDASRGLGMSSLKQEDAVSDYSTLSPDEMKVLDDWYTYFSKRYNIVGKVAST